MRYCAYVLDTDETVRSELDLGACDPSEALRRAEALQANGPIEIWEMGPALRPARLLKRREPVKPVWRWRDWTCQRTPSLSPTDLSTA